MAEQHYDETGAGIPALHIGVELQDPITVDSTSTQSNVVSAVGPNGTRIVALYYSSTDDFCHIASAANPTATTGSRVLPSHVDIEYTINSGDKLAVIANSTTHAKNAASGGHLFITQI